MNSLTINTIREAIKCLKKQEKISFILLDEVYKKFLNEFPVVSKQEINTLFGHKVYKTDSVIEAYRLANVLLEKQDKIYIVTEYDFIILGKDFREMLDNKIFNDIIKK